MDDIGATRISHHNGFLQYEPGLIGIGTTPKFAIGQRALLLLAKLAPRPIPQAPQAIVVAGIDNQACFSPSSAASATVIRIIEYYNRYYALLLSGFEIRTGPVDTEVQNAYE